MVSNCCNQNTQAHASSDAFAELMVALVLSSSVILAISVAGAMVVEFDVEFTAAVLAAGSGAMVVAVELDSEFAAVVFPATTSSGVCVSVELAMDVTVVLLVVLVVTFVGAKKAPVQPTVLVGFRDLHVRSRSTYRVFSLKAVWSRPSENLID